ncbi:hypothetical protein N7524_003876 [Penicillium chrysogenum]|nr:hypothetical protein N7524_003876 [Penicillium chrysogenum]
MSELPLNNDGRKPYRKLLNDAEVVAMNLFPIIKRRYLINILVSKERHFSYSRTNGSYELRWSEYLLGATSLDNPKEMDRRSVFYLSLIGSCAALGAQAPFVKTKILHHWEYIFCYEA